MQGLVSTPTRRGGFVVTSGGESLIIDLISTARRRGVPFTRVRRRGLCSMSGRYPYGIGNPPTLRRSSFPQRALRPAGGPIPKHTWGCAPRPPNSQAAAGYERCKHRPYGAADTLSRCLRRIFMWGSAETELNAPAAHYKRRLAPDPGGRRPSGRGK